MREPPAAPITMDKEPSGKAAMMGVHDDKGLFLGRMKFASEGSKPNSLRTRGMEKSFISLFLTNVSKSGVPSIGR